MKKSSPLLILVVMMLVSCKSGILTPKSTQAKSVLTDVLQALNMCKSRERLEPIITIEPMNGYDIYSFTCSNSADTNYSVSITHFDTEATAHSQFNSAQDANSVSCFHGYDQYETLSGANPPNLHIVEEKLSWQAREWIIKIFANYDYLYFHYNAIDFSEEVYISGIKYGLFPDGTCPLPSGNSLLSGLP